MLRPICPYVAPYNLQYDYKFISSGGCTSVLPDGGSLIVGVPLFVLSSAVLPNLSVFAFSVSVLVLSVPVFVFSVPVFVLSVPVFVFSAFILSVLLPSTPMFSILKDPGMFLRFRQSA